MVNNISNHCANDEWSPIHNGLQFTFSNSHIEFTGEIGQNCQKYHFYTVKKLSNLKVKIRFPNKLVYPQIQPHHKNKQNGL